MGADPFPIHIIYPESGLALLFKRKGLLFIFFCSFHEDGYAVFVSEFYFNGLKFHFEALLNAAQN